MDEQGRLTANDLTDLAVKHWRSILVCGVVGGIAAALVAFSMPRVYRSTVVLAPAASRTAMSNSMSSLTSRFGGLAALSGISLGAADVSNRDVVLATIRGGSFLVSFAERRDIVVPLFAAKGWSREEGGSWILDPDIYDLEAKKWVRRVAPGRSAVPSAAEIQRKLSKVLLVNEDRKTNLIDVTMEAKSPEAAAAWLEWIVTDLNDYLRQSDFEEAERTLKYLDGELQKTSVTEMRAILFRLIEEQTKIRMMTQVQEDYAVRVIDGPVVPDKPAGPARAYLTVLGSLGGMLLCFLAATFGLLRRKYQPLRGGK